MALSTLKVCDDMNSAILYVLYAILYDMVVKVLKNEEFILKDENKSLSEW